MIYRVKSLVEEVKQLRRENPKEFMRLQKEILKEVLSTKEIKSFFKQELLKDEEFKQELFRDFGIRFSRRSFLTEVFGASVVVAGLLSFSGLANARTIVTDKNVIITDPDTGVEYFLKSPLPVSAIVFKEDGCVKALNWSGDEIKKGVANQDDINVLQSVIDSYRGVIFLRDDLSVNTPISIQKPNVCLVGNHIELAAVVDISQMIKVDLSSYSGSGLPYNVSNVCVENVHLNCNGKAKYGLYITKTHGAKFRNIVIESSKDSAIVLMNGCFRNHFEEIYCWYCSTEYWNGVIWLGASTSGEGYPNANYFEHLRILYAGSESDVGLKHGIRIVDGYHNVFVDVEIHRASRAIYITAPTYSPAKYGTSGNTFIGVHAEHDPSVSGTRAISVAEGVHSVYLYSVKLFDFQTFLDVANTVKGIFDVIAYSAGVKKYSKNSGVVTGLAIDSTGVKTVDVEHGLVKAPSHVHLTMKNPTADDFEALVYWKPHDTDPDTYFTLVLNVKTASATSGATVDVEWYAKV